MPGKRNLGLGILLILSAVTLVPTSASADPTCVVFDVIEDFQIPESVLDDPINAAKEILEADPEPCEGEECDPRGIVSDTMDKLRGCLGG